MKKSVFHVVFFLGTPVLHILLSSRSFASPETLPPSANLPPQAALSPPSENIRLKTYEVEVGKTVTLPAQDPQRYLVAAPDIAAVIHAQPGKIEVQAGRIGSTLILWWEPSGIRSAQIVVTRPLAETKRIEEIKKDENPFRQALKKRTFKFDYETHYSLLNQGKVLPRTEESRKVYDHSIAVQGHTPLGRLRGRLFYEYRKDQTLRKSAALVRDMWFGLQDTDLPSKGLDGYDLTVGHQYLHLSDFGFPGARYNGFTLVPTDRRVRHPEKGRLDLSFFIGRERRGGLLDNPAGTNQRHLKLTNRLSGEKIDYRLWQDGRISLGAYQKWGGPTDNFRSKKNFDGEFDLGFPYVRLKGQAGLDSRANAAWRTGPVFENRWLNIDNSFFRVNPHYNTITGTTLDKGRRGYELRTGFFPLLPLFGNEDLQGHLDFDLTRDLLSLNPRRPDKFNRRFGTGFEWRLPWRFRNDFYFEEEDRKATLFPFTRKRVREKIYKDITFRSKWFKTTRLHALSGWERYGDAENTPGFNSHRYELGGGVHATLWGGFWVSSQYLWNRLDEKEPAVEIPDGRTYPGQLTVSGGVSHAFRKIPAHLNLSIRYTDERKTPRKIHSPFANEDRLEARGALNIRLPQNMTFFIETDMITAHPLADVPETAEFSLVMGARVRGDTPFYLPQKGTVEGHFFLDQNANGILDPGELGISGYDVELTGKTKAKTNPSGYYEIRTSEGPAQLRASGEIPEGHFFTTLNEQDIEIVPKKKLTVNFGIVSQTQVKGQAYLDVNRNSLFDLGDIPMPNLQILLGSGQMAVTSAQGHYSILRVGPGPNSVQVVLKSVPTGYRTLTPVEKKFEGMPGDLLHFDIVMTAERIVSGRVFVDTNRNGRRDEEEAGMSGVTVVCGGKKAVTSGEGKYALTGLDPGKQTVQLDLRSLPPGTKAGVSEQDVVVSQGYFERGRVDFPVFAPSSEAESP